MIGATVSHYRVLERLGGGGMGVVFKAEDTRLGRLVALKFLNPELTADPQAKARFVQEARTASALDHPRVCTIHEIDETPDGQIFIAMALVDGESLRSRIARGPLPVEEALAIAQQTAEGLAQAHAHGIVHRDVKPANVMLTRDGAVKIVDFGLATLAGRSRTTRTGQVAGTAAYMSPEQARGAAVDARSDVFSLGVVTYEMLAGRLPFAADSDAGVLHAIAYEDFPPLDGVRPGVPPQLSAAITRCLLKDPADRYRDAGELVTDLERVRRSLALSSAPTLTGAPAARRRTAPALLVVGAVVAAAALVALLPRARQALRAGRVAGGQQHIAVLPFTNVGGDTANRAFCDGLTEILTSQLTQLERFRDKLWVVPSSEVRAHGVGSAADARRAFDVNLAVTGSVQRQGDAVRLALNLVDTRTLRQVGSRVLDGSQADLPDVEDRVAGAMAEMLDVAVGPADRRDLSAGGTRVAKAYDLYVQGRGTLENYRGEGDPDRAAALFRQAAALDPAFALAQVGLAESYLEQYRVRHDPRLVADAVASARRALELDDRLAEVHVTLGKIHAVTGGYEEAASEFRRAIELRGRDADAFTGLARALDALGKPAEAEAAYERAIALKPDFWLGYIALGRYYGSRGRYDDAARQFQRVIELTPENAWGYNALGTVYLTLGRDAEARAMLERAVAIKPVYGALSNLGTLYFKEGKLRDAAAMYEKALAIRGTDYQLWGNLGTALHFSGEDARAKDAFGRAVALAEEQRKVNPRDQGVLIDMAGYCGMLGERARGLALVDEVLQAPPTDADAMAMLGESYDDLGERDRAIEWIGKALRAGYAPELLGRNPALAGLRTDPRFDRLVAERGGRR